MILLVLAFCDARTKSRSHFSWREGSCGPVEIETFFIWLWLVPGFQGRCENEKIIAAEFKARCLQSMDEVAPSGEPVLILECGLRELPLDGEIGMASTTLTNFHSDPAARFITVSAVCIGGTHYDLTPA